MKEPPNARRAGTVVQVIGPVVDVAFRGQELPEIYTAIRVTSEGFETPAQIGRAHV